MTRTHTATIEARRWKAHCCAGCGCRYAYRLVRRLAYGGSTPERAVEKAEAAAQRAMAREVERRPCPNCGLYQPEMVARGRQPLHRWVLLIAMLGFAILAVLKVACLVPADRALMIAIAAAALLGGLGFLIDRRNPNRNLEANRAKAQQEIAAQRMRILQPGTCTPHAPRGEFTTRSVVSTMLACGLTIIALAVLAAPELLRRQAGWPLNADAYPPVIGPGDTTRLYLPDWISSVKGYWKGKSRVTAQVADNPAAGNVAIPSRTQQSDWGKTISAKEDEKAGRSRLWLEMRLPPDSVPPGKTIVCDIDLAVEYPAISEDRRHFSPCAEQFHRQVTLKLSAPLAAGRYEMWWWAGFCGGGGLLVVSIFMRLRGASALLHSANRGELVEEP
jgi:hypothetical protein